MFSTSIFAHFLDLQNYPLDWNCDRNSERGILVRKTGVAVIESSYPPDKNGTVESELGHSPLLAG